MNQIHISCKFNLRKASSIKPMPIYLVVYISGKQYKVATGVKVLPFQWDKHRQMAIVSNIFSEIDNYNNTIANEKLSVMRDDFSNYLDYLCTHQEHNPTDLFRQIFCKGMAKNVNNTMSAKDAIKVINNAFSTYYSYNNPNAKESTQNQQKANLQKFIDYVGRMDKVIIKELLSQRSINDFREYLINNSVSPSSINRCGFSITTIINRVIAVHNDYLDYGVTPVNWVRVKDTRNKDEMNKHFPLEEIEIQAIKDCQTLTEREQEYRVMILLQFETGLRFGDLVRFMRGEYTERKNGCYYIKTEKNNTEAMIEDTENINNLLSKAASFEFVDLNNLKLVTYNRQLRTIAKKSGLNRLISGKDANGTKYEKPIHDAITSHCARYTFITNMCVNGMSKEDVILLTGHVDTKMIDEIYLRYNKKEKANKIKQARAKIKQTANKESKPENKPEQVSIEDVKEVLFAFSDIKLITSKNSPRVPKITNTILSTEREKECLAAFNNASESERAQFIDDVKSLNQLYYALGRATIRPLYKAYQEKMKLFGVTIEPDNYATSLFLSGSKKQVKRKNSVWYSDRVTD